MTDIIVRVHRDTGNVVAICPTLRGVVHDTARVYGREGHCAEWSYEDHDKLTSLAKLHQIELGLAYAERHGVDNPKHVPRWTVEHDRAREKSA